MGRRGPVRVFAVAALSLLGGAAGCEPPCGGGQLSLHGAWRVGPEQPTLGTSGIRIHRLAFDRPSGEVLIRYEHQGVTFEDRWRVIQTVQPAADAADVAE